MKKRVQCKACPWRVDCEPAKDIPGGYCEKKHANLKSTIAEPGRLQLDGVMRLMACHESPGEGSKRKPFVCVGWLANQLGPGNNLALRLRAMAGEFPEFKLIGPQHARFEDTLP